MVAETLSSALDIFKTKAPSLVGIDISSTSVKLVELSDAGKAGFRLERYAIEPLPKDVVADGNISNMDQVAEALRRGWKRLGSRNRNIAMALPAAMVITKRIIVPAGQKEEELELTVEAEANQYIPFALDEVNLDFQILGPAATNADEVEVLIAASRSSTSVRTSVISMSCAITNSFFRATRRSAAISLLKIFSAHSICRRRRRSPRRRTRACRRTTTAMCCNRSCKRSRSRSRERCNSSLRRHRITRSIRSCWPVVARCCPAWTTWCRSAPAWERWSRIHSPTCKPPSASGRGNWRWTRRC